MTERVLYATRIWISGEKLSRTSGMTLASCKELGAADCLRVVAIWACARTQCCVSWKGSDKVKKNVSVTK